jgi:hypothetical protein
MDGWMDGGEAFLIMSTHVDIGMIGAYLERYNATNKLQVRRPNPLDVYRDVLGTYVLCRVYSTVPTTNTWSSSRGSFSSIAVCPNQTFSLLRFPQSEKPGKTQGFAAPPRRNQYQHWM